jgi:hypothetical protein
MEKTYPIRMKSPWTGQIDGVEKRVETGEIANVDLDTFRALCFQHDKAEPVSVEELAEIATAKKKKPPPKDKPKNRASRTKAQISAPKDKMVKASKAK